HGLLLRWSGDRVRFMMPTTIAPRYGDPLSAGLQPHQIPEFSFDAERSFHLTVAVNGVLQGARFNSPSHFVKVESRSEEAVIELAGEPAMDRDFILEARSSQVEASGALVSRDLDGWVALASFRPRITESTADERRSTKIVVDCSGPMAGDSIAQAKVALERILDGLRPGDLFDIIAFGSTTRALFGSEMPVSETSLAQARRFVRQLDANLGGTEIGAALEAPEMCERERSGRSDPMKSWMCAVRVPVRHPQLC
ncbi:MAG: VWA domain-containing protein, partial [bacterium]